MTTLLVVEPGLHTTVQDLGRTGTLRYGIPPSGPMDRDAFILANRLVGNPDNAAGLECTLKGPALEFQRAAMVAVTGAELPVTLNGEEIPQWTALRTKPGMLLKLGTASRGCRAYVAISGGIDLPTVLGSRATYVRGRLGGVEGRPLRVGDLLPTGPPPGSGQVREGRQVRPDCLPAHSVAIECRVILGPQADRFPPEAIQTFLQSPYRVTHQADRMGYRLAGATILHRQGHDILSDGIPLGAVQVVGDGQPIVLLVDRQSTGGYTKIATVLSIDIPRIGQARPDHTIRFTEVTVHEAHRLLRARRAWLEAAIAA